MGIQIYTQPQLFNTKAVVIGQTAASMTVLSAVQGLTVYGDVSASGKLYGSDLTVVGNISARGNIYGAVAATAPISTTFTTTATASYVFNGYTSNGATNYLVYLDGVHQVPVTDYNIEQYAGSQGRIVFAVAPTAGSVCNVVAFQSTVQATAVSGVQPIVNSFTGTGSQTDFVITGYTNNNAAGYLVVVSGLIQKPGADYTVSSAGGGTVSFTTAPPNGTSIVIFAYQTMPGGNIPTSDSLPTGSVVWFAATTAPAGYLACNGAAISRTVYADLFAVIGTTHGAGDGSTTFNLPDLRGEFIRGWDNGRGVDPGRVFGSLQGAYAGYNTVSVTRDDGDAQNGSFESLVSITINGTTLNGNEDIFGPLNIPTIPGDTRPRNVALLPCIRAFAANLTQTQIDVGALASSKLNTSGGVVTGDIDAGGNAVKSKTNAKAFVCFDGTTASPTIRSSYNVASVTKNSTGSYTITFSTPLSDANYTVVCSTSLAPTSNSYLIYIDDIATPRTTTQVRVITSNTANYSDGAYIGVAIFR